MNKQTRERNGQYGEIKRKSIVPKIIVTFIVLGGIVGSMVWVAKQQSFIEVHGLSTKVAYATTTEYVDMTPEKIKKVQDKLLDELSLGCEVKGSTEPDGVLILDSNNKMSIGRFQFQIATVQHYVKQFENKDISKHDAIVLALDATEAKELARKIVFEVKGGVENNWTNCALSHQFVTQVSIIKEFMKL